MHAPRGARPGFPVPALSRPPSRPPSRRQEGHHRGQSLAEFALVVPVLLILIVVIADFGRVFAYGVTLEGAARGAAEATSMEYLANSPGSLDAPASASGAYYRGLHLVASRVMCADTRDLPGVTLDSSTGTCPEMPYVMVCVHDSADTQCGTEANGATIPAECTSMATGPTYAQADGARRYVEVRVCYRFDPILAMPLVSFDALWIQRTRVFEIPCYYQLGPNECG